MLKKIGSFTAILATALLVGSASVALADDDNEVRDTHETNRDGLILGIGVDVGHLQCNGEGCDGVTEAGGLNLSLGGMITNNLAIVADVWGMGHTDDQLTLTHSMLTVGPKVWLADRLWLHAGVGAGRVAFSYDVIPGDVVDLDIEDSTDYVGAGMIAAGVDIVNTDDFALDLGLRAGSSFFNDGDTQVQNLTLGLGVNWY